MSAWNEYDVIMCIREFAVLKIKFCIQECL